VALLGAAAMIEMIYHMQLNAALGPTLPFLGAAGHAASTAGPAPSSCCSPASACSRWPGALRAQQWGEIQEEIEREIKRREAA
jgi:branched-chain amino acid transport system permease protein